MDTPKQALFGLTGQQVTDQVKDVGLPAFAIGAGLTGLVATLAEMRRQRELQQPAAPRRDVLEVQMPAAPQHAKVAGVPWWTKLLIAGGAAGYGVKQFAGTDIGQTLVQDLASPSSIPSTTGAVTAPAAPPVTTAAVAPSIPSPAPAPDVATHDKNPLLHAGLVGAIGGLGLYGGYKIVDTIIKARREAQAQARLGKAKQEYSHMLGQSLMGPSSFKTASFPLCEETVRLMSGMVAGRMGLPVDGITKSADLQAVIDRVKGYMHEGVQGAAPVTSLPSLVALASAVAAHQFMYNREKQLEDSLTRKRVSPPKEIRLVSAPQAAPEQTAAQHLTPLPSPVQDKDKNHELDPSIDKAAADLAEAGILGGLLLGGGEAHKPKPPTPGDVNGDGKFDPIKPIVEKVDASTYRITTPAGAVTVDATDPNTRHILEHDHSRLAELLTSVSAIPQEEKVASVSTWSNIVAWDARFYSQRAA